MSKELEAQIRRAVDMGRAARSAYYAAIELDDEQHLGPPASDDQLAELEALLEKPLPPSYRTFLKLYDGWRMAAGDIDLLSVGEMLRGPRAEKIRKWQADAAKAGNHVAAEGLVIGFGEATSIKLLLNPNITDDDGEWQMVGDDNGPEWVKPSFLDWLEGTVEEFRELAQEEIEGDDQETE
jgi:hypothetical protein